MIPYLTLALYSFRLLFDGGAGVDYRGVRAAADFDRRGMNADAFTMITVAGLVGILGAKFYIWLTPNISWIPNTATVFRSPPATAHKSLRIRLVWRVFGGLAPCW